VEYKVIQHSRKDAPSVPRK